MVRTTLQATAAVIGGAQSLHTNAMDEALALPTEESAKLALRTQQIIAHESGLPNVTDPLAGSIYLETLTDELEKNATNLILKIDELGGAVSAIEQEFQQNEIASSAFDYQKEIDEKEKIIVGVNKFKSIDDNENPTQKIDKACVEKQLHRLKKMKENRNTEEVKKSLDTLKKIANGNENLVPYVINAVKSNATLGEISNALRSIFSQY